MNQIDASIFFDLLRLVLHRNDDKIQHLSDQLFTIYADASPNLSPVDIKYSELYIALIKEAIMGKFDREKNKADIRNLIQRYTNNQIFRRDKFILDAFKDLIETEAPPARLADITTKLNNMIAWYVSRNYITKLYGCLKDSSINYTLDKQSESLNSVKSLIDEFKTKMIEVDSIVGKSGPVELIDFTDRRSIGAAFEMYKDRRVKGALKTGLIGLNQMLGESGGIGLGESMLFAARSHNFKSGILMEVPGWISKYSTPPEIPGKKPMIFIISLENEAYMGMLQLFKRLYVSCKGHVPPSTLSDTEMIEAIYEQFNQSGYTLVIHRYLPSTFGYEELVAAMESYEQAGFKITATIIDYIALMKTHNGAGSRSGDHLLLQELFCKIVNYHKSVGTALFSAHQLNRGASDLVATGINHPVKRFSERFMAGSSGIFREVDKCVFMNLEADESGATWLTLQFGKSRYNDNIPEAHKFCAYKFNEAGLTDDLDGPFLGVRDIYKKTKDGLTQDSIEDMLGINSPTSTIVG